MCCKRKSLPLCVKNLDIIKISEHLELTAYYDIVNVLTIGYGSTYNVKEDQHITKDEAEDMLLRDVKIPVNCINSEVCVKLSQNEFDALVSLVYNIGIGNFRNSTLLKYLNLGEYKKASNEFPKWRKAGGKIIPGLELRREQEKRLFLS